MPSLSCPAFKKFLLVTVIISSVFILLASPRTGSTRSLPSAAAGGPAAPRSSTVPLEKLLTKYGTLNVKSGYNGSLDARGWRMQLNADGSPRFVREEGEGGAQTPDQPSTAGDENWDSQFGGSGASNRVLSIATSGTDVYIGGEFTLVNNVVVNKVAKWNGSSWSSLGTGVTGFIAAVVVVGSDVYVGGSITNAGGVPVNNVAKWNGSSWSALGAGVNGEVTSMVAIGSNLFVGGSFSSAGGTPVNNIAKWNGSGWSSLGNGIGNTVIALATNGSNVYAGGSFATLPGGGPTVNNIAKWDGVNWSDLGGGVNSFVSAISVSGTDVYVSGGFSAAGGGSVPANYIARWNGSNWSALGSGLDNAASSIMVSGTEVYVAGDFSVAGGVNVNRVAKWNGASWSALGTGIQTRVGRQVKAIAVSGTNVYVGGDFGTAGGFSIHNIARWNGSSWSPVGSTPGNGTNEEVNALAANGTDVYAGGHFTMTGDVNANHIARWNGNNWSALGTGVNDTVGAIAVNGADVYVGGSFTTAGGGSASRIAKWNGGTWSALGLGVNNSVGAIAVNGTDVYVGGIFTTAGGTSANGIAKWNGSNWSALGSGVENCGSQQCDPAGVFTIAISGNDVYVGGNFNTAGGVSANHIAKWNGSSWSDLGAGDSNGTDGNVYTIAVKGGDVYAGGQFTTAGGSSANNIARWNGSNWSAIGTGLDTYLILTITVNGNDVYAGGGVITAGGVATGGIAKWDGSNWSALGSGTNHEVFAAASSGNSIFVGGVFVEAGQKTAFFFGRWNSCSFSIMPTSQAFSAAGGTGSVAVTTTTACGWNATSNDGFIHITSGSSGTGNGAVSYSVDANSGPQRSGTMTIAGETFTVNQDSGCTFSINPTSQNFGSAGGNGNVTVTTANGCGWTATSNDSFITINSGTPGTGGGSVSYTVAASMVPARTGTMTVAGQTFTVNQASGVVWTISGRITDGTTGIGGIAVGLSGSSTSSTTTNSSGNYSFPNLPAGGTYTVMPTAATHNFNPQLRTFADLSGNRTADFVGTLISQPTPTPTPFPENFESPTRDPQVWNLGPISEPASFDPAVAVVQENGRLKITPRQNVAAPAFNGYNSVQSFNLTDGSASVEVVQPGTGGAETIFGLTADNGNTYFRFNTITVGVALRAGILNRKQLERISPDATDDTLMLALQVKIAGVSQPPVFLNYNPAVERFWRIRHNSGKGGTRKSGQPNRESLTACPPGTLTTTTLLFETSRDKSGWDPRQTIELCGPLKELQLELNAGTHTQQPNPGPVLFDNLDVRPTAQVQFAAGNYDVNEGEGTVNITIARTVDTTTAVDVDYFTADEADGPCNAVTGHAKQNCDYITAAKTIHFDAGVTQRTFAISVVDDAYVEGSETLELKLSNTSDASVGNVSTAVIRILENDVVSPPTNPIDDIPLFVRQQYLDFLNREPDAGGFGYWTFRFAECHQDARCIQDLRIEVADAFFFEPEFQQTGAYVFRVYTAAFGGRPSYNQFTADIGLVSAEHLDTSKTSFATTFVQRDAYLARYPRTQTASQFVDALIDTVLQSSGVNLSPQRGTLISLYDGADSGRAAILRRVADTQEFIDAKYNSSFVLMLYYGYLRRDPELGGFDFWLSKVNEKPLRDVGIQHSMACSFITSDEYQHRFNGAVTHHNSDCKRD